MKRRPRLTTVPRGLPARRVASPRPKATPRPPTPVRQARQGSPRPPAVRARARSAEVARIIDDGDKSLVDVIDNLLNQGAMLNADVVLALANVDLVYLRLSALLCAADRIFKPIEPETPGRKAAAPPARSRRR